MFVEIYFLKSINLCLYKLFFRLIKHTEKLLEEREENLCLKVLKTLKEMMKFYSENNKASC